MKQLIFLALLAALFLACGGNEPRSAAPESPTERPSRSFDRWPGATVPAPSFSPGAPINALWDTYYLPAAIELIDGAREDLDLVQFQFTYGPTVGLIQEALGRAVDRGVKVRVLLDEEPPGSGRSLPHLAKRGIEARLDGTQTRTHVKLILADRRRALFGSTNLSDNSINNNHETNLLVESETVGLALRRFADELWKNAERSIEIEPVRIDGLELHVDRTFEAALMSLLANARDRIEQIGRASCRVRV